jgi:hypothetical protein
MKNYEKYAAKDFKSKRLKKKQITRLRQEYEKLCKRHHIIGQHMTLSGPVPQKDLIACGIGMIYSTVKTMAKSRRGEILTMGDDGEMYYPKDKPGFVAR